ncbi:MULTISPECIES: CocE/NonD family hydrolase [Streptomyces]|uniref:CocE/NonD family hydrolase n=1 Tax=Streptomyces koelreuteriae TaxID=2838015 RepID=A0ABX8G2Q8_9ACTN|nr:MULTISPECIES: CocE/NonD family hydrolase [Streptomyces]QWB27646.1 CocE/NonD family hydrolase [Streptomyces koelreuteriae]UUA10742.1 CocE/NonD family hydrolase [Streptomyces koelreuteriae]UUA18349.1 CocE/NonD family hydrolase [Streptomyces sp. CRCS-T-1]
MKYRDRFERQVVREDVWIPTRDGDTRLHARIWRPADAESDPVPALLEYLPYRKSDWTAPRDAQRHPWYAGHGYASVRVDVRGHGDSEGTPGDEYDAQELADGVDVVNWLAAQPWCTGKVGMFGISWGGFNSLQIAALAPEPLKAVVTVCSTDDRYDNDVHYTGGAVLGIDMLAWAGTMLAFAARPPDPASVGADRWLPMWRERLDALEPFLHTWLEHQQRDDYWRHGSVCEDYTAIDAAVLAVGGWNDPYRDTVLRLVEHLPGDQVRGIVGPWSHQYPDRGLPPGPAIGFLQETLRWWDQHLKGVDTGVMAEPLLRSWLNDPVPPSPSHEEMPGRWVTDAEWPSPDVTWDTRPLGEGRDPVVVRSPLHTGLDAGRFFPFGNAADLPPDQREEDGRSVCFDSAPLEQRVEILGRPRVRLRLDSDTPRAHVIARVCDVAPDGSSTLVTRGVLNLLSRKGREHAVEWTPGTYEDVEFELNGIGYAFPPGHRVRVAVSDAYWPWVWPHGERGALHVVPADSAVLLPVREAADEAAVRFEEPEQAVPMPVTYDTPPDPRPERLVTHDVAKGEWTLDVDPGYGGSRTYPDGLRYEESARETYTIRTDDPLSARAVSEWRIRLRRGDDWDAEIMARTELRATAAEFIMDSRIEARGNGETVAERAWHRTTPRTSG